MTKRVLIVDDDEVIRELTFRWLHRAGYDCLLAETGDQARSIATTEKPDAIIMDYYLQEESGVELTSWLKHQESTRHIPVLGLTSDPYARRSFIDAGAEDQLTKPVGQHVFILKVMSLIAMPLSLNAN